MNTRSYTSTEIDQTWLLLDAKDKTLGRLASYIASHLRGKHKPEYTQNADLGDFNEKTIELQYESGDIQPYSIYEYKTGPYEGQQLDKEFI